MEFLNAEAATAAGVVVAIAPKTRNKTKTKKQILAPPPPPTTTTIEGKKNRRQIHETQVLGVAVTLSKNMSSVQVYVYEWLWLAQEQMIGWATTNGYLFWHPLIILFCFFLFPFHRRQLELVVNKGDFGPTSLHVSSVSSEHLPPPPTLLLSLPPSLLTTLPHSSYLVRVSINQIHKHVIGEIY